MNVLVVIYAFRIHEQSVLPLPRWQLLKRLFFFFFSGLPFQKSFPAVKIYIFLMSNDASSCQTVN